MAFIVFALEATIGLGTNPYLLIGSGFIGLTIAIKISASYLTNRGAISIAILSLIAGTLGIEVISAIPFVDSDPLRMAIVADHLMLTFLIGWFSTFSSFFFYRSHHTQTLEALGGLIVLVAVAAGHRNLRLELPKFTNQISWWLGWQQLSVLVILAGLSALGLLAYLIVGSPYSATSRTINKSMPQSEFEFAPANTLIFSNIRRGILGLLIIIGLIISGSFVVYNHYQNLLSSGGKLSNGVGQSTETGSSPLGFHSALGGSNMPAALVRLDSDYANNPSAPMLYLRESALSQLGGLEMIIASPEFDTDTPRVLPGDNFTKETPNKPKDRIKLSQSVFLLSSSKASFAVDYPLSFAQLRNPKPERFQGAYRAVSAAPTFKLDLIQDTEVGQADWTELDWKHYTATSSDKRYEETALRLTSNSPTPVRKALALSNYLNKNATYTLTPNHEVQSGSDPVAPFLFGDMRGYCVHFAHAMVYMLRSLGIPARIATGYLTDVSQAKDGHILLRMSDRHAWAEVNIRNVGWVPFDVQPEKVESHADSDVDMSLLEELMNLLQPGEEILPESLTKNEPRLNEPSPIKLPSAQTVLICMVAVLCAGLIIKLYLRFGWCLASTPKSRLRRSYRSLASFALDLGLVRNLGETRNEYLDRCLLMVANSKAGRSSKIDSTTTYNHLTNRIGSTLMNALYNESRPPAILLSEIDHQRRADLCVLIRVSLWRRVFAFFNPRSILGFFTRGI